MVLTAKENLAKSCQLAEQAGGKAGREFLESVRESLLPDFEYVEGLSEHDLLIVWNSLMAPNHYSTSWRDPGPHNFSTMDDWAQAIESELSRRGIAHS